MATVAIQMDFEFKEEQDVLIPISIGLVAQTGEEYYAVIEHDPAIYSEWLKENVACKLFSGACEDAQTKPREIVKQEIIDFVAKLGGTPKFCGYYSSYDWIAFCWIFGSMSDLPEGWPWYCWDLVQYIEENEIPKSLQPANPYEHNALYDARQQMLYQVRAKQWLEATADPFGSFLKDF